MGRTRFVMSSVLTLAVGSAMIVPAIGKTTHKAVSDITGKGKPTTTSKPSTKPASRPTTGPASRPAPPTTFPTSRPTSMPTTMPGGPPPGPGGPGHGPHGPPPATTSST